MQLSNVQTLSQDLRIRVTDKARTVAASMLELVELLHEAEMTIDTSDDSAKLMDTTRALLGICPTYDAQPQAPPPAAWPSSTYIDDDFYSNPNFFKAVEEIERVVHERNALSNVPSFSLGLSQDVGMSHVEHMITIGTVAPRERAHAGGIEQARAKRSAVSMVVYHRRLYYGGLYFFWSPYIHTKTSCRVGLVMVV